MWWSWVEWSGWQITKPEERERPGDGISFTVNERISAFLLLLFLHRCFYIRFCLENFSCVKKRDI